MNAQNSAQPVAMLTGAGGGIGRAAALLLARRGWRLTLAGRTRRTLEETAAAIPAAQSLILTADIADPAAAKRLVDDTFSRFGRIDALINNAGLAPLLPIEQTDPETLRRVFETNAIGPGRLIHHVWPVMAAQKSGRIVNVSTLGTRDPFPGFFAYAASKAALNLFAQSCAKEGAEHGIRAFSVAPGAVETGMLRALFSERDLPPEACMSPEDVAEIVVACAAGERDEDNGRTIFLSAPGGRSEG